MNRKDFFKTAGRFLLLGGITASAGYLIVNNKETENFHLILKKSLHESQKLFGPLADAMVASAPGRWGRIVTSIRLSSNDTPALRRTDSSTRASSAA